MVKLMLKNFKGASPRLESAAPTIVSANIVEGFLVPNAWTSKSIIQSEWIMLTCAASHFFFFCSLQFGNLQDYDFHA